MVAGGVKLSRNSLKVVETMKSLTIITYCPAADAA
jgi:hypothetical protein